MYPFLSDDVAVDRVSNAVAAGSSDENGDGVSLAGFDGVLFIALIGTLSADQETSLKAQQSADDGDSDAYTDIEGSDTDDMADDDDNGLLVLDVFRPEEEFVRPVVERSTGNAVIDGVIAIRYHAKDRPVTQPADVIQHNKIADPVAGTA